MAGGWRRGGVGRVPGGARGGAEGEGWGRGERWRAAGVAARTVQRWQPRPAGTARRARQAARHGNRGNASSAGAWALTAAVSGRQRSASAAVGPPLATTTPSAAAKHAAGRRSAARQRRLADERRGDRAIRPRRSSATRAALDAPCEAAHAVERCRQRRRRRRSRGGGGAAPPTLAPAPPIRSNPTRGCSDPSLRGCRRGVQREVRERGESGEASS